MYHFHFTLKEVDMANKPGSEPYLALLQGLEEGRAHGISTSDSARKEIINLVRSFILQEYKGIPAGFNDAQLTRRVFMKKLIPATTDRALVQQTIAAMRAEAEAPSLARQKVMKERTRRVKFVYKD